MRRLCHPWINDGAVSILHEALEDALREFDRLGGNSDDDESDD